MKPRALPPAPPLWFSLLLLAAWALVAHLFGAHDLESNGPQLAWVQFVIMLAGWVWQGLQVAARITLYIVAQAVQILFAIVRVIWNVFVGLGGQLSRGFQAAWGALRTLYSDVLLPAWRQFWTLVDRVRDILEQVFGPILDYLERIRTYILDIYDKWVRPVMDSIDIARKVLKVLAALHVDFARELDKKLAELQEWIDYPFRFLLDQINQIINAVNRIMTVDGLLQRLALIRSIERDIRYVSRAFMNWRSRDIVGADYDDIQQLSGQRSRAKVRADFEESIVGRGRYGAVITEAVAQWSIYLGLP